MLETLKNLNIDRLDLDEAIALSRFARSLRAEYEELGLEIPEWLDSRTRELRREIKARNQDYLEKRLKEAKDRYNRLKPAEEQRDEARAEVERLEKMVGGE